MGLILTLLLAGFTVCGARQPDTKPAAEPAPLTPEEERERLIQERFLGVLEKNPRRGTALDRVYGYHVERGSLDALIRRYTERTKKTPTDGTAWMVLGLLEAQRGRDAQAVAAFRQAETQAKDNALASFYLGQSLVLVGQPDAAAEAFERAIARKPARADLLDAFQALGRV
jgi:tetratricopeptide (TPR) repeat protein